jgi:hypothetical protein
MIELTRNLVEGAARRRWRLPSDSARELAGKRIALVLSGGKRQPRAAAGGLRLERRRRVETRPRCCCRRGRGRRPRSNSRCTADAGPAARYRCRRSASRPRTSVFTASSSGAGKAMCMPVAPGRDPARFRRCADRSRRCLDRRDCRRGRRRRLELALVEHDEAELGQRGLVQPAARGQVADPDLDVVDDVAHGRFTLQQRVSTSARFSRTTARQLDAEGLHALRTPPRRPGSTPRG